MKQEKAGTMRMRAATFADVFAYIERHYKKTGQYLSYGKAVARMEHEVRTTSRKKK